LTYAKSLNRVLIEMESEEYNEFMLIFGDLFALAVKKDKVLLYRAMRFLNAMNRTNPEFCHYDIPEKFREPR